mmetsp:Transcript_46920/g.87473  ORF Transcript_46920/g.87473 Transcript_46920/m.87473 type:complete len:113 (+) Transcript_46920:343-681(+)
MRTLVKTDKKAMGTAGPGLVVTSQVIPLCFRRASFHASGSNESAVYKLPTEPSEKATMVVVKAMQISWHWRLSKLQHFACCAGARAPKQRRKSIVKLMAQQMAAQAWIARQW